MAYINILEIIYPVGSLYFSTNKTSPAEIVGGTWELIEHNRFLLTTGLEYDTPMIGGQSSFTIAVSNLPSHSHGQRVEWEDSIAQNKYCLNANGWRVQAVTSSDNGRSGVGVDMGRNTGATGGGQAIAFWPPWYRVHVWRRIS